MNRSLPPPLYLRALVEKKDADEILAVLGRIEVLAPAAHVSIEATAVKARLRARSGCSESSFWQSVEDAVFRLSVSLEKESGAVLKDAGLATTFPDPIATDRECFPTDDIVSARDWTSQTADTRCAKEQLS